MTVTGGLLVASAPVLAITGAVDLFVRYFSATVFAELAPAFVQFGLVPVNLAAGAILIVAGQGRVERAPEFVPIAPIVGPRAWIAPVYSVRF